MIKTELKGKLVAVLVIALIVTSVFSGAVSAGDSVVSSNRESDNKTQVIPEGNCCGESTTKNAVTSSLNLSERIDEILEEGNFPFLFFYADWCGFCEKQKPIIEELEKEYADSVEFLWLNVEEYEEEAQEFGVSGHPTMFLIVGKTEEGYQYKRFGGYTERDELAEDFERVIETGTADNVRVMSFDEGQRNDLGCSPAENRSNFNLNITQENLSSDDFLKEMANDSKLLELIAPANEIRLNRSQRIVLNNETEVLTGVFVSEEGDEITLVKVTSPNLEMSYLMKSDNESVTLSNFDGSTSYSVTASDYSSRCDCIFDILAGEIVYKTMFGGSPCSLICDTAFIVAPTMVATGLGICVAGYEGVILCATVPACAICKGKEIIDIGTCISECGGEILSEIYETDVYVSYCDGAPTKDATVYFEYGGVGEYKKDSGQFHNIMAYSTDDKGFCEADLYWGDWEIWAEKGEYVSRSVFIFNRHDIAVGTYNLELYPKRSYVIVEVTDDDGNPIPNAEVKFDLTEFEEQDNGIYVIELGNQYYQEHIATIFVKAEGYQEISKYVRYGCKDLITEKITLSPALENGEICEANGECKSNYCASPCTGESKHCCNPGQHWSGTQCVDYCICQDDSECPPHCYVCDGYKCVVDNTKDKGEGKCCGDGYFFEGPNACCDNTDCDVDNGYACSNHKCLLVDTKICTEDSQCISQNCASCEGVPEKRCCPVGMMWNGAECVESCTSCPDMCYPSNINYRLFDGYPYSYGRGYDGANCPKNHNSVIDLDGDGNYDCCYLKEKCDTGQCYDGKCPSEDERRSCEEFVVTGPLFSESGGNTSGMECRHGVQLSGKPDNTWGHLKCPAGKICYTFDRNLFYSQCEECECGCDTPLFPNRCKKDCGVPDGVCHESRCGPDTLPKFDTYDQVRNNRTYTERYIESCEPSSDTGMRKYYDYEFCRSSPLNEEPEETNENLWRPEIKTYDMNCYDGGDTKEEMYRLKAGCKPPIPDDFWMCGQYGSSPRCYNPEVYECCAGSDLVKKDQDGDGVQDHMCCIDEIKGRWCVGDVPADSQKVIDFAGKNIMEDEQNCGGCGSKCTKWVEGACYEYEVDQNFRCGRETPQCCNGVCTEPKPDLSVKKIAFYPEILIDGNSVMVLVTVKRMDEFYSENILTDNVTVELYIDEILKDNTTTTILPDSSQAVILFWNANVSAGEHEVRISIDTNDTVDECNEKNNDLTKTIIVNKKPDLTFNDRIDTFSDGSKEKLLKWNSAGDKTVYIKLPKNAKVEKASLDISYKEETTETSRSLETYCSRRCVRAGESVWCNAPDVVKTVDPGDGGLYNFTVYTPNCNPNYGDTIEYKVTCHGGDGGTYDGCGKKFNFKCTKVSFKVDCSGWHPCHGSARYYAECGIGANPQITYETLPTTNPSLNIDGDDIWYYEGEFNTTETVPDFSKEIQTYLDNCSPDGNGYCSVPLTFHSGSGGDMKISGINVNYRLIPNAYINLGCYENASCNDNSPDTEDKCENNICMHRYSGEEWFIADATNIKSGDVLPVSAILHNIGETDTNQFITALLVDDIPKAYTITSLTEGESQEISFNWTAILGEHNLTITADSLPAPDGIIPESMESNNKVSRIVNVSGKGNTSPVLSYAFESGYFFDGVEPDTGDESTIFEYRVKYMDYDNHSPASGHPTLWIDINGDGDYSDVIGGFAEGNFTMTEVDPSDSTYTDGKVYSYTTTLPAGENITHKFEAVDETGRNATGDTGVNKGPYVTGSESEGFIFDTGKPANPYPSIMGIHNGTIKPNQTVTVQKLYTYPCAGTGGHSEHVRIWNDTWIGKEAHWKGYQGDWHNITFDEPFTLFAEKTYYYEIRTGSYPQIIHKPEHTTLDDSFINCTSFVDANGKEHTGWIPAIRLWS